MPDSSSIGHSKYTYIFYCQKDTEKESYCARTKNTGKKKLIFEGKEIREMFCFF
jgi:hypothetical protein